MRYLQSYRDDAAGLGTRTAFPPSRGDEELGKYHNKYEESMNPFEAFRGRVRPPSSAYREQLADELWPPQERGRAVHMLNPLEKVLLSLASVVLSNRLSRNVFVFYALALHFVVLSTLYSITTSSPDSVAVHMPVL